MKALQLSIQNVVFDRRLDLNVPKYYTIIKRALDIIGAIFGILLFSPLMLFAYAAIRLESAGSPIFLQQRIGLHGKIFKMYKFRSMVNDAERMIEQFKDCNEISGHMFKIKEDPRITHIGRIIRKSSIDELPQLFNILKGEMSFVGPRPPLIREVKKYEKWHHMRMSVKPGLTGLWQISGRNSLSFDDMIRLDLKYIRERSLRRDLKIILLTVPVLFGDCNAF